jgi:hypothetical protein
MALAILPSEIHVEADEIAFFIGHLKGHVAGLEAHTQFAPLQDFLDVGFFCQLDVRAEGRSHAKGHCGNNRQCGK